MRRYWSGLLLAVLALLATGCSAFIDQDQPRIEAGVTTTLTPNNTVGQTFVARHSGLEGLQIWLAPGEGDKGEICLHLRSETDAETDLVTGTVSLAEVNEPAFHLFSFPALPDSQGRYYYAFLEMTGEGRVQVGRGPGDAYLDGALYQDHQPLDAQMAFRLAYDGTLAALNVAGATAKGAGLLAVSSLLYILPGWALLTWLWSTQISWAEKLGLAAGLSLALYPVLFLWTDLVGLHLGSLYAWLPIVGGLGALGWRCRDSRLTKSFQRLRHWARSGALWPDLTLVALLAVIFAVRLFVVRSLDAPMWGDSYQHTMITQLLVDNGGLFDSWEPYERLTSLTYHFGLHSAMAVLHWVTGLTVLQTVLVGAQVLNGLAVLALYPLAVQIGGNRWAGVGAVLVAGLLSPMPMEYVNWGRYTQLAGQVILPVAVLISWRALEGPDRDWRLIALAWLTIGGLALTHYRVLIFYVVFVVAWAVLSLHRQTWRKTLSDIAVTGCGGALLFTPWFIHIFGGSILRNLRYQLTTAPSQAAAFTYQYNAIGDLSQYMGPALWLLLAMATALSLWRRRRPVLLVVTWWFLLFIATNPRLLGLPGSGVISNFALFIAGYVPASIFIGYAAGEITNQLKTWRAASPLAAALVLAVGLGGVSSRMRDVQPARHAMVTRPDIRAMAWIREHTPEDSRFLVNSFFAYGGSVVVGSDGGWWLPLLAGRNNTVPPLSYNTEEGPDPGYRQWVNDFTARIQETGPESPAALALLKDRGITHVYVGQQHGRVNYAGPQLLDPDALKHSEHYEPVYHRDRVWVFEVGG